MNKIVEDTNIADDIPRITRWQGNIWKVIKKDFEVNRKKKICAKIINEFTNDDKDM
jgi:hypothetical protein